MPGYNEEILKQYEERISALEAQGMTEEEREINRLVVRTIRSFRSTLWLINGSMKYFAAPLGIAYGFYTYGAGVVEWLFGLIGGQGK